MPTTRPMIDREFVLAHRRDRLVGGTAVAVAQHGYAKTTVAHIVHAAGVARNTFYEEFSSKEAVFLALLEAAYAAMIARAQEGCAEAAYDPRAGLRSGLLALLAWIDENPAWAKSSMIEAPCAGPPGRARLTEAEERLAGLLQAADPPGSKAVEADALMRVAGAYGVIRTGLLSGDSVSRRLEDLEKFLTQRW